MKNQTWYVFYRMSGHWYLMTDTRATSAREAISRCYMDLVKYSGDSGYYRAFRQNRLPWGAK